MKIRISVSKPLPYCLLLIALASQAFANSAAVDLRRGNAWGFYHDYRSLGQRPAPTPFQS